MTRTLADLGVAPTTAEFLGVIYREQGRDCATALLAEFLEPDGLFFGHDAERMPPRKAEVAEASMRKSDNEAPVSCGTRQGRLC